MKDIKEENIKFNCPNDGDIKRDDVLFLCNTCKQEKLIFMDGIYICPSCLKPGQNFECSICESKEVEMRIKKEKKKK